MRAPEFAAARDKASARLAQTKKAEEAFVIARVPCSVCKAETGERCRKGTSGVPKFPCAERRIAAGTKRPYSYQSVR